MSAILATACSPRGASTPSIHFAAFAYVGESVTDPAKYYANNLLNSLALLDACRTLGRQAFVFSSTCATYGTPDEACRSRKPRSNFPINPYGNTKLAFERALADYAAAYPFGFCALRYFNAAGASADGIHRRRPQSRDASDSARVIQAAMGKRSHGGATSLARTTRRRTAPASATTSTSTIWLRRTCWRWGR